MSIRKAQTIIIFIMIVFGTVGLFFRNIPLSVGEIALYRAIIAVVAISGYLFISKRKFPTFQEKKELILLIISGIMMAANWVFLFLAYNYTTISIAILCYYFAPAIIMIACPILFKEKLTTKQVFCFLMTSVGLVLIIGVSGTDGATNNVLGVLFGIGAACLYASIVIVNKMIKTVEGIDRALIQFFVAGIILIPYVLFTSGINIMQISGFGLINLLSLGLIHTALLYCLYFSCIRYLPGQRIAIISYTDPLVAVVTSVLILGEAISLLQILGGVMILGFTLINEINIKGICGKKRSE